MQIFLASKSDFECQKQWISSTHFYFWHLFLYTHIVNSKYIQCEKNISTSGWPDRPSVVQPIKLCSIAQVTPTPEDWIELVIFFFQIRIIWLSGRWMIEVACDCFSLVTQMLRQSVSCWMFSHRIFFFFALHFFSHWIFFYSKFIFNCIIIV